MGSPTSRRSLIGTPLRPPGVPVRTVEPAAGPTAEPTVEPTAEEPTAERGDEIIEAFGDESDFPGWEDAITAEARSTERGLVLVRRPADVIEVNELDSVGSFGGDAAADGFVMDASAEDDAGLASLVSGGEAAPGPRPRTATGAPRRRPRWVRPAGSALLGVMVGVTAFTAVSFGALAGAAVVSWIAAHRAEPRAVEALPAEPAAVEPEPVVELPPVEEEAPEPEPPPMEEVSAPTPEAPVKRRRSKPPAPEPEAPVQVAEPLPPAVMPAPVPEPAPPAAPAQERKRFLGIGKKKPRDP